MTNPYPVEFFESVNNTVPRFNGEQGRLKVSGVVIDDADNLIVPNGIIFGDSGVAFKYKKIEGFTSGVDGGVASTPHNLNLANILFFTVTVRPPGKIINSSYEGLPDYEYNSYLDESYIHIENFYFNCFNILNVPFVAYIGYIE